MKTILRSFQVLVCLLFLFSYSFAQSENPLLRLKSGTKEQKENAENALSQMYAFSEHLFDSHYYVGIQFKRALSHEERLEFQSKTGIELITYLPDFAYTARIPLGTPPMDLKPLEVFSVFALKSVDKAPLDFNETNIPTWAEKVSGFVDLHVTLYKHIPTTQWEMLVTALDGSILAYHSKFQRATLRVPINTVSDIIELPIVQWAEPVFAPSIIENEPGKKNHRSLVLENGLRNLTGSGINIGIWDGGSVYSHLDLSSRLTLVEFDPVSDHATHVSGIMAGAGWINPYARGMAPNAHVYSHDFNDDITAEMETSYNNNGILITQNSYGSSGASCLPGDPYDSFNRELDLLINDHNDLIHIFSAGNSQSSCTGGWGTTTGKASKNALTVAAVSAADVISTFSSFGPLEDGRIKPEISAHGVNVYSTMPDNAYGNMSGTSMACPGVSGTTAQVYERYHQLNAGANPVSSLIKAVLCNGADDLGNAGPDYKYGFGRINGLRAVKALEDNRYQVNTITHGATQNISITVPAGTADLKVMIVWSDVAAAANANPSIVNNLNLSVIDPTSATWLPWTLDPANPGNTATRAVNNRDIIEQVTIPNPVAGTYTLRVNGANIASGPNQKYSITWNIDQPYLELVYPAGGEGFAPSSTETIQWDGQGITGTQTLEYSTDNGTTWTLINNAIPAATRSFDWVVPSTITDEALVRVSQSSLSSTNAVNFSIIGIPTGLQAQECANTVVLSWNGVAGASSYDVLQFNTGTGTYAVVGNTTSTNYAVSGLTNGVTYWFTIRARHTDGALSERAIAISATPNASGTGNDLQLLSILSPYSGCNSGLTASEFPTIRIRNVGCATVAAGTNIPVSYTQGVTVNETMVLGANLAPGAYVDYTFTTGTNLSAPGTYTFSASVSLAGDGVASNNSISGHVVENNSLDTSLPYLEDFENPLPGECWTRWTEDGLGFLYGTNLGSTYLVIPNTTQYAAANDDDCGDPGCGDPSNDYLISPHFDLSIYNSITTEFDVVYPASAYGSTAYVEVSYDKVNWTTLLTVPGVNATWQHFTLDVSAHAGQPNVWFAFHHDDNGNWGTGFAVDNFELYENPLTLVSLSPVNGATNVSVSTDLVITFNQPPAIGTGTITITDGVTPITINLPDPQVTVSGNTIVINPTSPLASNTTYTVTLTSGAITTPGGLPVSAATYGTWSFTTQNLSGSIPDFSGTPLTACMGQTITFTDASTGTVASYSWNFGAGASPATATGIGPHAVTYSSVGTKNVSLTINGATTETKNNYVTIVADPVAGLVSSDADNSICLGDAVTFTASGGSSYEFFVNGTSQGAASATNTFTTSSLTNGQIVTVIVGNGSCSTTSSGITTTVIGAPVMSISDGSICNYQSGVASVSPATGTSYDFYLDGVLVQSGTSATYTIDGTTLTNGSHNVQATVGGIACPGNTNNLSFMISPCGAPPIPPVIAPDMLIVTALNTSELEVKWMDRMGDEEGYDIFRSKDIYNFTLIASVGPGSGWMTYYDTDGIEADTRYYYQIRAKRGGQMSNASPSADDTTYPYEPVLESATDACLNSTARIEVSGTHASNAYRWYTEENGGTPILGVNGTPYAEPEFISPNLSESQVYYVASYGNKYESQTRLAVSISIASAPVSVILGEPIQYGCEGPATLTAEEVPGSIYFWYRSGVKVGMSITPSYIADAPGTYQVLVIASSGCETMSNKVQVFPNFKPTAEILQGERVALCQTGVLQARSVEGAEYSWTKDGDFIGSGSAISVSSSGIYTLSVSQNGCTATDNIEVRIDPLVSVTLTSDTEILCPNSEALLTVTDIVGASYEWILDGRLYTTTNEPFLSTRKTGSYSVRVLSGACSISTEEVFVNRGFVPTASLVILNSQLEVRTEGDAPTVEIHWFKDDVELTEWMGLSSVMPTEEGSYHVEVLYPNGCSARSLAKRFKITGFEDTSADLSKWVLYPNPTNNSSFLKIPSEIRGKVVIELRDDLGRSIKSYSFDASQQTVELTVSDLASGMYHLNIQAEDQTIVLKWIIE